MSYKTYISKSPVFIEDARGVVFYDTTPLGVRPYYRFNVPDFPPLNVIQGELKQAPKMTYKINKMPPRERSGNLPQKFNYLFGHNPLNKVSVYKDNDIIIWDAPKFKDKRNVPMYILVFILYHEAGHYYYETEELADLYAINSMLERGYNPTQIFSAILLALSPKQKARKLAAKNYLKNLKQI